MSDRIIPLHPPYVATNPGPAAIIWNPGLMQQYGVVVQYDGWDGKASYQCATCYQRSLTCTSTLMTPMSSPPKVEPSPGTKCCSCKGVIRP